MRSPKPVFGQRRRRRAWPWILLLFAAVAAGGAWILLPMREPAVFSGLGQPLSYQPIGGLPAWAQEAVRAHGIAPDYQLVAAVVDLNRDEQAEIVVAPAPARADLFIPDLSLRVLTFEQDRWRASASPVSCRPSRLGSFLTDGYWDLRCRDGRGSHVLRWNGVQYVSG